MIVVGEIWRGKCSPWLTQMPFTFWGRKNLLSPKSTIFWTLLLSARIWCQELLRWKLYVVHFRSPPVQSNFNKVFSVVIGISIKTYIGTNVWRIFVRVLWSHRVEIGPRTLHKRNLSIRKTIGLVQSAIGTKPEELRVVGGGRYFLKRGQWGCDAGCRSPFHKWIDYNGVAHFRIFG